MNQSTSPSRREPDELDELLAFLLKCDEIISSIWDDTFGRKAQERELKSAQNQVSYFETLVEHERSRCQSPARCMLHRCRRRHRCEQLEEAVAKVAAARADVTARRAQLQREFPAAHPPLSEAAQPPARERRKGRTRARP